MTDWQYLYLHEQLILLPQEVYKTCHCSGLYCIILCVQRQHVPRVSGSVHQFGPNEVRLQLIVYYFGQTFI